MTRHLHALDCSSVAAPQPDAGMPDAGMSDAELLRCLRFRNSAGRLAKSAAAGDPTAFVTCWQRRLRDRFCGASGKPGRLPARFPEYEDVDLLRGFFQKLARGRTLANIEHLPMAVVLEGLRRYGDRLAPRQLWPLWRFSFLTTLADADEPADATRPAQRVLAAESLWASGLLFDGIVGLRRRRNAGRKMLQFDLATHTSGAGCPHAASLPSLPVRFAAIVRADGWSRAARVPLWNRALEARFHQLVRVVALALRPDGRLPFTPNPPSAAQQAARRGLWPLVAEGIHAAESSLSVPVTRLLPKRRRPRLPPVPTADRVPVLRRRDRVDPPVLQSDAADLVLARNRWDVAADAVAVAHSAMPLLELRTAGRVALSGVWGLHVWRDEVPLPPPVRWDCVSWFCDAHVVYIELHAVGTPGITLCRQVLLSRGEHQLLLADSVSTPAAPQCRLRVETTLPLAADVQTARLPPLRELRFDVQGLPLRAFPVTLPMDALQTANGRFCANGQDVILQQSGSGGVYAAVALDWHPQRREAFADWRTLTVTQDARAVPRGEAAGVRFRIGSQQLLLYRRLNDSQARRAVLGHHHAHESVIARVGQGGTITPLVLVD